MIKLTLSEEIEEQHRTYFKNNIVTQFNDGIKLEQISDEEIIRIFGKSSSECIVMKNKIIKEHRDFMEFCKREQEVIAKGKPKELKDFISRIKNKFCIILKMLDKELCLDIKEGEKTKKITYNQKLLEIFGYNYFVSIEAGDVYSVVTKDAIRQYNEKNRKKRERYTDALTEFAYLSIEKISPQYVERASETMSARELKTYINELKLNIVDSNFDYIKEYLGWSPYKFVFMSNIRVCPYCNRQYITPVLSEDGRLRADLDHFYPKSKYPYLAMSLYNLIPCCKFCNSSLKGVREFGIDDINPYEDSYNSYFKFVINPIDNRIEIEKLAGSKERHINKFLSMFKIESLYNYHTNQGKEIIKKRIVYSDSYIKELLENKLGLFNTEEEIKELIVGYVGDKDRINEEAFAKLRRDIAMQIGFINSETDAIKVEALKKLIKESE